MKISIKAARINAGLTQQEVASATGFSRSALLRWENGQTFPRADKLERLCKLYRVEVADIQLIK